jgi:ribosomal-protein-serine acetyltransferase
VTICVAPDNARSRAIPARLGFTEEGLLREAERTSTGYHDLLVYGLLEQDWRPTDG